MLAFIRYVFGCGVSLSTVIFGVVKLSDEYVLISPYHAKEEFSSLSSIQYFVAVYSVMFLTSCCCRCLKKRCCTRDNTEYHPQSWESHDRSRSSADSWRDGGNALGRNFEG